MAELAPSQGRQRWRIPSAAGTGDGPDLGWPPVNTRMLIILALICGLAILVAFAVQAMQII